MPYEEEEEEEEEEKSMRQWLNVCRLTMRNPGLPKL